MSQTNSHYIPLHLRIYAASLMALRKKNKETVQQISDKTGISRSQLYELENKSHDNQSMVDKERAGCPPKLKPRFERRVVRLIKNRPFDTSSKLTKEVNTGLMEEEKISIQTFKKIAVKKGLPAQRPSFKPMLEPRHIVSRYEFAKEYRNRDLRFWRNIFFADEVSLELHPKDSRKRVRRGRGERYKAPYVVPTFKYGGEKLMFWGCLSYDGPVDLVLIEGTLKGDDYKDLLDEVITLFYEEHNRRSICLVEDHSRVHDCKTVSKKKVELKIRSLNNYPANSPDLNAIEHIWAYWKKRVQNRNPQTLEQLETYAYEEWDNIPLDIIHSIISSMPKRLEVLYSSRGLHAKY